MKKLFLYQILILFFFFMFQKQVNANASMPAFWNTGSGHTINIFDKNTKIASKNIRMDSEKVVVMLYQGFSVVKGEYNMFNDSNKEISVDVGYPENKVFENPIVKNIVTGQIYNLEISINDKENKYETISTDSSKKWYVWKTKFKPKSFTKITVHFLTDNHYAKLSQGYDSKKSNGFTYILESGKAWKDKIGKGDIYIKLMNDVSFSDILAIFPKNMKYDEKSKTIIKSFQNLEPNGEDNIVISYEKSNENFNFSQIKEDYKKYFQDIDSFKIPIFEKEQLKDIDKDNFEIPYTSSISFYLLSAISLMGIIFFISFIILIKMLFKRK